MSMSARKANETWRYGDRWEKTAERIVKSSWSQTSLSKQLVFRRIGLTFPTTSSQIRRRAEGGSRKYPVSSFSLACFWKNKARVSSNLVSRLTPCSSCACLW